MKEYDNIRLCSEQVTEFPYQPGKCRRPYRVIVLRKNLSIEKGERKLFDKIRYFFYGSPRPQPNGDKESRRPNNADSKQPKALSAEKDLRNLRRSCGQRLYITNDDELSPAQLVEFANERCNQENLVDQLKNGLNALRMPVGDLVSNWAYMVMASLAWTLKAWFALSMRRRAHRDALLTMEFRRFLHGIVLLPTHIIRTGRRIVYRILVYDDWVGVFLRAFEDIGRLRFA